MKSRSVLFTLLVVGMLVMSACGAAAPAEPFTTEAPAATEAPAVYGDEFAAQSQDAAKVGEGGPAVPASEALPLPTNAAYEIANPSGDLTVIERANRMIVKNADIRLMVEDTNVAIDRSLQIVGDAGGYIVSSRVWYQDYYGNSLKYASVTIGVPVDEFENVMRRLRGLAVQVLDENATGEDVTDQYVDLQSQLTNLESTRARIQEFLKDAKTVDEALRVNQELANIEAQIEQIKGRMNYLTDRSAFSTITINLEPEFPVLTPTPTSTPKPTATPIPWKPADTFNDAKGTVTVVYQGIANFLIWLVVVILPIVLPPALILWAMWKLLNRKVSSKQ
ncbi:MAG: DUF4349 domain-containing protein [Anaerolineales bacterium]|nr:MAG: DUF4349 domain-containing protein [Anaerolineales bacterium]